LDAALLEPEEGIRRVLRGRKAQEGYLSLSSGGRAYDTVEPDRALLP